jgi:hypothetical protein
VARSRRTRAPWWSFLLAGLCAALLPAAALGADRVYWANAGNDTISFANLDGSGGGQLPLPPASLDLPVGVALDPARGRIYWANGGRAVAGEPGSIWSASLDGSGSAPLPTGAATVANPAGIALDPAAGRIYWANSGGDKISFAKLDGSGGGDLQTDTLVTVAAPAGVVVDPGQRIYWTNTRFGAGGISFLSLGAPSDADLDTGAATAMQPQAVALDPAARKVWWVGVTGRISFADLLDAGSGDLDLGGFAVSLPAGIAIDPGAGRLWWSDDAGGGSIASASLSDQGAARLATPGAVLDRPTFLALLRAPQPAGPPAIGGGSQAGAALSCSQGAWAADLVSAFLYRAPQRLAYQWSRNGADVPGAVGATLRTTAAGDYRCRVTASNAAGATAQTSAPLRVSAPSAFGAATRVTLALAAARIPVRGPLSVRVANANAFAVAGTLSGQTSKPVAAAHRRRVRLAAKRLTVPAGGRRTVALALPATLRRELARRHGLALTLSVAVTDPAGHRRTVTAKVTARPVLKRRR